ncbi:formin-like protein 3 isoform X1 [Iris pallida]|uniref:Formin-like protein 3 isoform X1 n=1 Tax=Iris pallida TaxID=29817 RepID=A0AAX6EH97_IRIPA|nr:formin-like protein 3 isoform X1 [Iris pallida]
MGGITSSIAARFAFFPPTPASYQLAADPDTDGAPSIPEISAFSSSCSSPSQHDVLRVRTRKGHDVVAVHVRNARATDHAALLPRQRGRPRPDVPAPRRSQRLCVCMLITSCIFRKCHKILVYRLRLESYMAIGEKE